MGMNDGDDAQGYPARTYVFVILLVGLFLSIAGPFGTYEALSLPARALYWVTVVALAMAAIVVSSRLPMRQADATQDLTLRIFQGGAFIAIFAPLLYGANTIWADTAGGPQIGFVRTLAYVTAATIVMSWLDYLVGTSRVSTPPEPAPRLYQRLNAMPDVDIARLTVNDHYVDVYLADGSQEKLLMRFSDAIAEMSPVKGTCTHRSHWVTEAAADKIVRVGQRDMLVLTSGTQVPVSRRYRDDVLATLQRKAAKQ
ncbi:LytTR family DNA-binding domain-containing protein [Yoonia sp. 208BN28-4]|uniref:LytTR family DNA-binding domain-containing protein n=1 Tax=Yoonia sp. 208BN28-4 TaxID=3126505 RepID=UPI00309E16BA